MEILEYLKIELWGGWWFTAAFGLFNLFYLIRYPRRFSKRLFKLPTFNSILEKVTSIISMVLFMRGMMIYTIFIAMEINTIWFYTGLLIYLTGMVFYLNAMKTYAETPEVEPVTTGAYKISRHPMQVFSLIMWIGVGIATFNWIILLICCIQPFLANRFLQSQERYCLELYGQMYRDYQQRTPRYIFL